MRVTKLPMDPAALYTAIVESTDAAVVAKDLDGTVIAWNPAAEKIFGWSAAEIVGQSIRIIVPDDLQHEEDAILERIRRGEPVDRFETRRIRKDGTSVTVAVLVSPVRDASGAVIGASKVARDATEEVRVRQQREAEARFFAMIGDNLPVFAWLSNSKREMTWANKLFREAFAIEPKDYPTFNWPTHVPRDMREEVVAGISAAVTSDQPWEGVIPIRAPADGLVHWLLVRSNPIRDRHGNFTLRFATGTDITAQRESEERKRILLKEVNHRTRNMLAMIQSMARRTAATGGDFVPRLESRIAGVAATQDLLVSAEWAGVPLRDLIAAQLGIADQPASRFDLAGPDLALTPGAAESIGMALNELANNAARFGALSVPDGRVTLHWSLAGAGDDADVTIDWREQGGPAVTVPTITGFGSRIIEDVPRGKLCGAVELAYATGGFHWRLTSPARLTLAGRDGG